MLVFACKKDTSVLGVGGQPATDVLGTTFSDTSKIYAHTVKYDTIASFSDRFKFLGSNHDPYFGRTDVGLYVNLNIPNGVVGTDFGLDANLVSAEIILTVQDLNFIGNNTITLNYSVFPISTAISNSVAYYTNQDGFHNKNSLLANAEVKMDTLLGRYVIRIPIDNNYAKAMLNNTTYLADNTIFQNTYKGFYITTEGTNLNPVSAQGLIAKYDVEDAISGLYLYYQNGTPSATKTNKKAYFSFSGSTSDKFNTVKYHSNELPPSSNLYQQIIKHDTTLGKDNLYLKGLGGTKVKFYIPSINNYADSFPVSVNRAEVIFNLDPSFITPGWQYLPPPKLALLPISTDSRELFALDELNITDLARYDGNFDATNNRYVFNIARQVQSILRGRSTNYGFYLVVADPTPLYTPRRDNYIERVILAGSNNALLKPKFSLSYVKLRNDKK